MTTVLRPSAYGVSPYTTAPQPLRRHIPSQTYSGGQTGTEGLRSSPFGLNNYEARKTEAEICHRFVQISCAKMHASRQSRSGARLYENLLILRLLAKARRDAKMLPYECADLLRRRQYLNSSSAHHILDDEEDEKRDTPHDLAGSYNDINQNYITPATELESPLELEESATQIYSEESLVSNKANNEDKDFSITMSDINENMQQEEVVNQMIGEIKPNKSASEKFVVSNEMDSSYRADSGYCSSSSTFSSKNWKMESSKETEYRCEMEDSCAIRSPDVSTNSTESDFEAFSSKNIQTKRKITEENPDKTSQTDKNEMRFFNGRLYERVSKATNVLQSRSYLDEYDKSNNDNNNCSTDSLQDEKNQKANNNNNLEKFIEEEDGKIASTLFSSLVSTTAAATAAEPNADSYSFQEWCQSTSLDMSASSETAPSNGEIPSLHTIMSNPVSPPLKSINNDIFSNFHVTKTVVFDRNKVKHNFNYSNSYYETCEEQNETDFHTNNLFCECDLPCDAVVDDDVAADCCDCASDSATFCRKRKTISDGKTAICEKRYCCNDEDDIDKTQVNFDDIEQTQTNYCNKCGGQKTKQKQEDTDADIHVPDINIVADDSESDIYSFEKSGFHNVHSTKNFSGWLMNQSQLQQQQYQKQCYNYQSNSVVYRHINNSNYSTINNNNNIQHQHQQMLDQIVPVARRNHFVGPIVGLVAETPYILMF